MSPQLNVMSQARPTNRLATDRTGDWREVAACTESDAHLFYDGGDDETRQERRHRITAAKAICADCPVATLCVQDAVNRRDTWGIRGGLEPAQIKALLPVGQRQTPPSDAPPRPVGRVAAMPKPTQDCPNPDSGTLKLHTALGERICGTCLEYRRSRKRSGGAS